MYCQISSFHSVNQKIQLFNYINKNTFKISLRRLIFLCMVKPPLLWKHGKKGKTGRTGLESRPVGPQEDQLFDANFSFCIVDENWSGHNSVPIWAPGVKATDLAS